MEITKVINNNVLGGVDESGRETIWIGNGIGFKYKSQGTFDKDLVQKKFHLESPDEVSRFARIVEGIPYEYIKVAEKIISIAHRRLGYNLDRSIHIGLTEHMCCAVERKKRGVELTNELLWEIKNYYPEEFWVGEEALGTIERELGVRLAEDEAGFIAMHIVNAEMGNFSSKGYETIELTKDILNIIKYHYQTEFDQSSSAFKELMIYIKNMIRRMAGNQMYQNEDEDICALICTKYPNAYECSMRIAKFLVQKMKLKPNMDEIAYMTLNINRVMKDK